MFVGPARALATRAVEEQGGRSWGHSALAFCEGPRGWHGSGRGVPVPCSEPPHVRLTRRTSSPLAFWEPWRTSQKSALEWSFQEKEVTRLRWRPTPLVSSWTRPDTEETRSS